jgi:hypothetical protein
MRKILAALYVAAAPIFVFCQPPPEPAAQEMAVDLETIQSFHPRLEGSANVRATLDFIESRLTAFGLSYSSFDFSQAKLQHSFSSCIRVDVAGRIRDTVIVAVPLNHLPNAETAEDGSVDIALALGLLSRLKDAIPPVSVTVLFLGAEFGATPDYPMGSRLFLDDFRPDYRVAVLYLNFRSIPGRVLIRGGGTGVVSPYWLMDRTMSALRDAKIPFVFRTYENQVFRLGLAGESTIIEPYLFAGYPAVSLEGDGGARDALPSWPDAFHWLFDEFLAEQSAGIPEEWDRHYLYFQIGEESLLVPEKAYVVILAAVLLGTLLYSLIFLKGLKKYVVTLLRNSPRIIPIFAMAFGFLLVATYTLEAILTLRRFPNLWSYAPLTFLILKATILLALFNIPVRLFRRHIFLRNGSFYSSAAIFFLLADIVVVSAIDISFSLYFLWAFLFILAAALIRNRWGKLLFFLPSVLWGIRGLMDVFLMPALPFCRAVLLSPIWGNLLFTAAILPFILFVIRLGLLFRGAGLLRHGRRSLIFAGAFTVLAAGISAALADFTPFGPDRPQPLVATQTLNANTGVNLVELESPAPIGSVRLREGKDEKRLDMKGPRELIVLPTQTVPVEISMDEEEFLQKKNVSLRIHSRIEPGRMRVYLSAEEQFILLDCSFPFIRESDREYQILIGAFPPNPLDFQLTLPEQMSFTLTLSTDTDAALIGVEVLTDTARIDTHLHLIKSIGIRT